MKVEYKDLKSAIIKACEPEGCKCKDNYTNSFSVNMDKLTVALEKHGINLIPVPINSESKPVRKEDIPYLSEYLVKKKLKWLSDDKFYTVLTFVDPSKLSEDQIAEINKLVEPQTDDPDYDKTKAMAAIVADYPCYFATIVSYKNNDPKNFGKLFYEIICRANKVVIKSDEYEYNHKDMA